MSKDALVIIEKLQAASKKCGVSLTFTNMRIYFKLLEYAEANKKDPELISKTIKGVRFEFTTVKFAAKFGVAPGLVTDTLRKLSDCGIIKYIINSPKPSVIELYKEYY